MLIGLLVSIYVYVKFIKSIIFQLKAHYDDAAYTAKYHKSKYVKTYTWIDMWSEWKYFVSTDPDLALARLHAQERRTQLLQEKYKKDAEKFQEKQEEVFICETFIDHWPSTNRNIKIVYLSWLYW